MEKNYSSTDRSALFDRALSLPHFDEEATLLSARPVVPLNQVRANPRFMPRVIFGFAILTAILVGAISATLLLQTEQNSQRAAESELRQPAVSTGSAAGGSTSESAQANVPALDPEAQSEIEEVPIVRDASIKRTAISRGSIKPTISRSSIKPTISRSYVKPATTASREYESAEDFERDERELRRADRRDARREARRQLRNRREQRGDDVLRIREIFEGPRP